jgi:hypothetical protein
MNATGIYRSLIRESLGLPGNEKDIETHRIKIGHIYFSGDEEIRHEGMISN